MCKQRENNFTRITNDLGYLNDKKKQNRKKIWT